MTGKSEQPRAVPLYPQQQQREAGGARHAAGLGTQFSEVDEQLWPLSYPQKSSPAKRVRGSAASRLVWRVGR